MGTAPQLTMVGVAGSGILNVGPTLLRKYVTDFQSYEQELSQSTQAFSLGWYVIAPLALGYLQAAPLKGNICAICGRQFFWLGFCRDGLRYAAACGYDLGRWGVCTVIV